MDLGTGIGVQLCQLQMTTAHSLIITNLIFLPIQQYRLKNQTWLRFCRSLWTEERTHSLILQSTLSELIISWRIPQNICTESIVCFIIYTLNFVWPMKFWCTTCTDNSAIWDDMTCSDCTWSVSRRNCMLWHVEIVSDLSEVGKTYAHRTVCVCVCVCVYACAW